MKRITVLGNFSGRNAGDNAILGNLLDDLSGLYGDVEFLVPTLSAKFVTEKFSHHRVKALGLMPWNASLKIFGLPTLYAMLKTDLVLITDNLLFDRRFFDPSFNYLSTFSLIAPLCRRRRIPIILYNASVGPVETRLGVAALRRVLSAGEFALVRDCKSQDLLDRLGIMDRSEVIVAADCALNTAPPGEEAVDAILGRLEFSGQRPLIGFNVNSYIDSWSGSGERLPPAEFVDLMAATFDRAIDEFDVDAMFFVTQVMDGRITEAVRAKMRHHGRTRTVANPEVDYREIAGLLERVELLVGMRTHALILSAAVQTPMVGINAYPKTRAFMETLGMENWCIEFQELRGSEFYELISTAWNKRVAIREQLARCVPLEQTKARGSAAYLSRVHGFEVPSTSRTVENT